MENHLTEWKIVLKLITPLQIGAGTLGMVEKSEPYIPGRLLWAVLTAGLTRTLVKCPDKTDYDEIGDLLGPRERNFATLFPSFDQGESCWLPVFAGNRREWRNAAAGKINMDSNGILTEAELEARLFSGLSGNATDPQLMATAAGTLHETDLISPVFRNQDNALLPLMFCGRMRLPEQVVTAGKERIAVTAATIAGIINKSRFGGGRKRGRGVVSVHRLEKMESGLSSDLSCRNYDDNLVLLTSETHRVTARHVDAAVFGRARLATFREHSRERGSGGGFSRPELCWQIGTLVERAYLRKPNAE